MCYANDILTRTKGALLCAVVTLALVGLFTRVHAEAPRRVLLECEAMADSEEEAQSIRLPRAASCSLGKGTELRGSAERIARLSPALPAGKYRVFVRGFRSDGLLDEQLAPSVRLGSSVARFRWRASPKRAWWLPGETVALKEPAGELRLTVGSKGEEDDVELDDLEDDLEGPGDGEAAAGISAAASFYFDCIYVTSDLSEPSPPQSPPPSGGYSTREIERGLASVVTLEKLRSGLTFYAPFDETGAALSHGECLDEGAHSDGLTYVPGMVGSAVFAGKEGYQRGAWYPFRWQVRREGGTMAFWVQPAWDVALGEFQSPACLFALCGLPMSCHRRARTQ